MLCFFVLLSHPDYVIPKFGCLALGSLFLETGPGVPNWQQCLPEVTSAI